MTSQNPPQENESSLSAGGAGCGAQSAVNRMAERVGDSVQDLACQGRGAALEARQKLETQALHARLHAEQYIHDAPFKSVLLAAGTGALTAMAVSWYMRACNKR